jgi:glycosyltransferase involved in cell wall biosynthesis
MKKAPFIGVLSGDGPQRNELEKLAADCDIQHQMAFLGSVSKQQVWGLLKYAKVFISLSAYEGCPNAVLEAIACQCPLVVSDIPAHREILDERSALFVNPHDIGEVADAIVTALSDRDAARERANVAKAAIDHRSPETIAGQYARVYRDVLVCAAGDANQ